MYEDDGGVGTAREKTATSPAHAFNKNTNTDNDKRETLSRGTLQSCFQSRIFELHVLSIRVLKHMSPTHSPIDSSSFKAVRPGP
jgi:hypothetical protein